MKQNESIKLVRNPDYWKPGRPYLDAIEFKIIANRVDPHAGLHRRPVRPHLTAEIAAPLLKDLKAQAPWAICEMLPTNTQANLLVNRDKPPFDDAEIRKAMVLAIDRNFFTDIIGQGTNQHRRHHAAAAGRPLGHAAGLPRHRRGLRRRQREGARRGPQDHGASWATAPTSRSRSRSRPATSPTYRDQAVILIDHLKQIYIQGELEPLDTAVWYNRIQEGLHRRHQLQGSGSTIRTSQQYDE